MACEPLEAVEEASAVAAAAVSAVVSEEAVEVAVGEEMVSAVGWVWASLESSAA